MEVKYEEMEEARRSMLQAKKELSEYMESPDDETRFRSLCAVVQVRTQQYLQTLGEYMRQQYARLAEDRNEDEAA